MAKMNGLKNKLTLRLCAPRGFCAGVERAIEIVVLALKKYGAPVYVRHEIVHNSFVVQALEQKGAVFIEDLEDIPQDKRACPVIFSAHGVPKSVPAEAKAKNLFYLDATCPLVSKVHKQARRHQKRGRHLLLIGHAGHPEVVGTMGQVMAENVTLIESQEDAENFVAQDSDNLGYVTQTTLSVEDTEQILKVLKKRYPAIEDPAAESICYATTNRQQAVRAAAAGCDFFIIIGSPNSSNSKRLVEVAEKFGAKKTMLMQSVDELDFALMKDVRVLALSAGASAPQIILNGLIKALSEKYVLEYELVETAIETETFLPSRELRDTKLETQDMNFLNGS